MPKQLPLSAYEEIQSGLLSKRQAIEKYNISQARFMKIRGPLNPTKEEAAWRMLERRSLTDKEKIILEESDTNSMKDTKYQNNSLIYTRLLLPRPLWKY